MFHYALAQVDAKLESQTPDKLWFFGDSMIDLEFARNINARLIFLNPIHIEFKNDYRIEALTHEAFLKDYSIISH